MIKEIQENREHFNNSIAGCYKLNEQVEADRRFAFLRGSQWEGSYEEEFANKPKPENNKVAKAIHRLLGQYQRLDLNARIMSNSDDATDEDADLLQSRWRNDFNFSDGQEALFNASKEAFSGGYGAVKLVAKYEDEENPDPQRQYLCIEPIYSAASSVVWDAGAIKKDKSDAKRCWQLLRVNRKETEEEFDVDINTFPQSTYEYFDWNTYDTSKDVYIAHYWEVKHVTIVVYSFNDGELIVERRGRKYYDENNQRIDKEDFEAIKEFTPYTESKKKVKEVWYALMDGSQYLIKPIRTPFKRIPVIPQYGLHNVFNGVEHYCGEVAGSRDPQMFENMLFASLGEILAQPQVAKQEYLPEQVEGSIAQNIADENKHNAAIRITQPAYGDNNEVIALGPIGQINPPEIGSGLATALGYINEAQNVQNGTGQSTVPANVSAQAIMQVNNREDDAYQPMFQNAMQTIKAICQCWIPAAKELYFNVPRKLRVMSEDGNYSQVGTMQYDIGPSGDYGPYKNTARGQYDVTVKAGEASKAQKEVDQQSFLQIAQMVGSDTEMGALAINGAIQSTSGEATKGMRKLARFNELKMLMAQGIDPQPKTDEEKQYIEMIIQQMQQPQQPDAMTIAAMAEKTKAQSDMLDSQVKAYNAETQRAKVQIDAQKAGADIALKTAQTNGTELDNVLKFTGQQ